MSKLSIELLIRRIKRWLYAICFLVCAFLIVFHFTAVIPTQRALHQAKVLEKQGEIQVVVSSVLTSMAIAAGSNVFHDFVHSGIETRSRMKSEMEYLLARLPEKWILGHRVIDDTGDVLVQVGTDNSRSTLSVGLCYLGERLDAALGICKASWTVYLSPKFIDDKSIPEGTSRTEFVPLKKESLVNSSFKLLDVKNLGVRIEDSQQGWLLFYVFEGLFVACILLCTLMMVKWTLQMLHMQLVDPLNQITQNLSLTKTFASSPMAVFELDELTKRFEQLRIESLDFQKKKVDIELGAMAAQVSHDIRSPLSALEVISSSLLELPEEKRVIIRNSIGRIRDIANSLLQKYRAAKVLTLNEQNSLNLTGLEKVLLFPLIESLVTEKRVQFRDRLEVQIYLEQTRMSYGLFSTIEPNELKRILSNLINNAIESLPSSKGDICVSLEKVDSQKVRISVLDNGKGIPNELISELGKRGATFGKKEGSGLGLFHAKEVVEAWGGNIEIVSKYGTGSCVSILLALSDEPYWFVPRLVLKRDQWVITFDDDQTIHQIWKDRFSSLQIDRYGIRWLQIGSVAEFKEYYRKNFSDLENALFLIDYEFLGSQDNGLDVIESLGISAQSILVTSRYEEEMIRNRCERLKLRLIPKSMAGFVSIEVLSS